MTTKKDLKIFEALNYLRKDVPHIFALLDMVNISVSDKIPTACVSWNKGAKKFDVFIGQEFYDALDALNISAVLEHEIYHVLFEHLFCDNMPDKNLANVAQDAIINDCIGLFRSNKCNSLLDSRVKLKDINKNFDVVTTTSLDVYKYLLENQEKAPENYQGFDDHSGFNGGGDGQGDGDENGQGLSEIDRAIIKGALKETIKSNEEAFTSSGKMAGKMPADLSRVVSDALKVEYNFKMLFETCVKKSLRAETNRTWKKLNRRLGEEQKGHKKAVKPNVLLVVDTSGSINDEILAMVQWQVDYLSKYYNFTVCWGDTSLKGVQKIKRGQKSDVKFTGGGGTDLNFFKDVREKFDLIIFDTDGYIAPIDSDEKTQKIFCIFPGGVNVDGYKNIKLDL